MRIIKRIDEFTKLPAWYGVVGFTGNKYGSRQEYIAPIGLNVIIFLFMKLTYPIYRFFKNPCYKMNCPPIEDFFAVDMDKEILEAVKERLVRIHPYDRSTMTYDQGFSDGAKVALSYQKGKEI